MKLILIQEIKLQVVFHLSEIPGSVHIPDFILSQILECLHIPCWFCAPDLNVRNWKCAGSNVYVLCVHEDLEAVVVGIPQASSMFLFETGSLTAGNFVRFTELAGQPSFRDPLVSAAHSAPLGWQQHTSVPHFPHGLSGPRIRPSCFQSKPNVLEPYPQLPKASVL